MSFLLSGDLRRKVRDAKKQTNRLVVRQQEVLRVVMHAEEDAKSCKTDLLNLREETYGLLTDINETLNRRKEVEGS